MEQRWGDGDITDTSRSCVGCKVKLIQATNTPKRDGTRYLAYTIFFNLQIDFARVDFPEPEIPQVIRTIVVVSSGAAGINCARTWDGISSMKGGEVLKNCEGYKVTRAICQSS